MMNGTTIIMNSKSKGTFEDVSLSGHDDESHSVLISQSGYTTNQSGMDNLAITDPQLQETLAAKENTAVRSLRVVIILIMLVLAVLASVGLYLFSANTEQREFENEFEAQGLQVISGFQGDSFRKLQAMESLSNSFTAYSQVSGEQWPLVTIPNSAAHFKPYLSLTNAASLLIMPIVGPRQRYEWETYAVEKQGWIDEDLNTTGAEEEPPTGKTTTFDVDVSGKSVATSSGPEQITPYIKNYVGIDTSPNPWIVWWQYAPVIPNRFFVNFNRLAWEGFADEVKAVKQGRAVLSKSWAFTPGLDLQSTKDFDFIQELLKAGRQGSYESGEPLSYIHYPVFDNHDTEERKTAAILTATVYWRTYFQNILPESDNTGIVCVIENTDGQKFSYKIRGPEASFLGSGDLHDQAYDHLGISADYADFQDTESQSGWYTGVPVDTEYISYRIHVYPSKELEASYSTNRPILYAVAILAVFGLTTSVFVLYDFFVARRQNIVMKTAVKSNAVVESLFPSNVRDQIMDNAMEQQQRNINGRPGGMDTFKMGNHAIHRPEEGMNSGQPHSTTIADLYPETTICFADLAGFTKWSSTRTPSEVFELLEAIYGSFDRVAARRKVFKIETIGDCYMCVTGIPNPQKEHAVIMARFARDCQAQLYSLTHDLAETLGEDTKELEMRVGLHSGPTTGGVLRGDKSRFQLFGDTVNTASRMESNGVRGRIHVSQATADVLTACGKGQWLVPREEKIQAKGKGEMQTYFLNVAGTKTKSSVSDSYFDGSERVCTHQPSTFEMEGPLFEDEPERSPTIFKPMGGPISENEHFEDEPPSTSPMGKVKPSPAQECAPVVVRQPSTVSEAQYDSIVEV